MPDKRWSRKFLDLNPYEAEIKPHASRYWLTPPVDEEFDAKVKDITGLYLTAIECSQNGTHTISVDEMTGIQAIERLEKD